MTGRRLHSHMAKGDFRMSETLTTVAIVALEGIEDSVIASALNALTFEDTGGIITFEHIAYEPFLNANLIKEDGQPQDRDSLLNALIYVISERDKVNAA